MAVEIGRARIAILGCGRVGTTFALAIVAAVYRPRFRGEIRLWSRSPATLRRARAALWREYDPRAPVRFLHSLAEAVDGADVVLLCVSDEALEGVARKVSNVLASRRRRLPVVLFASGSQELARVRAHLKGFRVGRLHPLYPVLLPPPPRPYFQTPFALEGDAPSLRTARALVARWQASVLLLKGKAGTAASYHAGAALLGGGIVSLCVLAEHVMTPAVRSRRALRDALCRFAVANVVNVWLVGARKALTGPLARGSEAIVRGHLRALQRSPDALEAYRVLGRTMLELARTRGSIDAATHRRLARMIRVSGRKR